VVAAVAGEGIRERRRQVERRIVPESFHTPYRRIFLDLGVMDPPSLPFLNNSLF